jgi:hypothetical protein
MEGGGGRGGGGGGANKFSAHVRRKQGQPTHNTHRTHLKDEHNALRQVVVLLSVPLGQVVDVGDGGVEVQRKAEDQQHCRQGLASLPIDRPHPSPKVCSALHLRPGRQTDR